MSLSKFAKSYAALQAKYAHLNAFTARIDLQPFLEQATTRRISPLEAGEDWDCVDGKPVAIKDNICTKDLPTTAASGMLKDFTSPYNATVVDLLQDAGAVVVGKTNMDEFGMGSHSIHSHAGPVVMERYAGEAASAGGSSGGSAVAVATAQCWAALGTDTGGSVRLPAAYTGVVGFKPSYGLLSRWGVIDYANSLDTVGILAANVPDARSVFAKLNVHDPKDPTSLPPATRARINSSELDPSRPLRIGIPLDYNISSLEPVVRRAWIRALQSLERRGHTLHPVRLPATQSALSAYYVLAPAEASSNLAKYDGVRFGSRAEGIDGSPESVLFAKTRGEGFGSEVQRRILLGAFSLSAQAIDNYFIQAQKVRRLVQQDFDNVFAKQNPLRATAAASTGSEEKVDVLVCPTAPTLAPSVAKVKNQDPLRAYTNDVFTVPASLAGLPAASVPIRLLEKEQFTEYGEDFPGSVGIQVIGQYGDDDLVLNVAHSVRRVRERTQNQYVRIAPNSWGHSVVDQTSSSNDGNVKHDASQLGTTTAEAEKTVQPERKERYAEMVELLINTVGEERIAEGANFYGVSHEDYLRRLTKKSDPLASEKVLYGRVRDKKEVAGNRVEKFWTEGWLKKAQWAKVEREIETLEIKQKEQLEAFKAKHKDQGLEGFKAKQRREMRELVSQSKTKPRGIRFITVS